MKLKIKFCKVETWLEFLAFHKFDLSIFQHFCSLKINYYFMIFIFLQFMRRKKFEVKKIELNCELQADVH